jgi:prevent-host-death family protein
LATTASELRANIYRMLDEVLETGQPLEIVRNGKTLVIAPKEERSIWDRLPRREGAIVGDPDKLIHIDWSSEWNLTLIDTHVAPLALCGHVGADP